LIDSASETAVTIRDAVADGSFGSDLRWKIRADQRIPAMRRKILPHNVFQ
jgi:hypothetical protein